MIRGIPVLLAIRASDEWLRFQAMVSTEPPPGYLAHDKCVAEFP